MLRACCAAAAVLIAAAAAAAEVSDAVGRRVAVRGFWIDATEVTIARFREFAYAPGLRTAAEREGGGYEWDGHWARRAGWNVYRPYGREPGSPQEPAVRVTWHKDPPTGAGAAADCRAPLNGGSRRTPSCVPCLRTATSADVPTATRSATSPAA